MKDRTAKTFSPDKKPDNLLALERLITGYSTALANVPVSEIDGKIEEALGKIVGCVDLDRCSFWDVSEDQTKLNLKYIFFRPGLLKMPSQFNIEDFPWVFRKSMKGDYIYFNRLDDLPEEAKTDKESFRKIGAKSSLIIPYAIAGKAIAGMTFAKVTHERTFHIGLITRLKLFGEIITGAFYRKKMEERYQKSVTEAQSYKEQISVEDFALRQETKEEFQYEGVIGESAAMKYVFSRIEQVAATDSVVLVLGETGVGKGVIARVIHELSQRKGKNIVTVNCAALTPSLIESELFGREKGAYTGSTEMQIGRFELADKGTLVLDEITELPLDLQAKLLRAIQEGEFERLGSPKTIKVDVRILALTSRNLKEEVAKGRFRQELYYRINVFPITIPPLRERLDDIPLLADYFVTQFNRKMQKKIKNISKSVMTELTTYSWPGNVRELEHVMERAVIITQGQTLHLAERLTDAGLNTSEEDLITNLAEVEKRHITRILNKTEWRIEGPKGAAILLGLHPNTLRGRMQKLGISLKKVSA